MAEPLRDDPFTTPPPSSPAAGDPSAADATPHRNAFESAIHHLVDAGPEVAEHVVGAAQELLLAAQAVITAAERAVAEQRAQRGSAAATVDPTLHSVADGE